MAKHYKITEGGMQDRFQQSVKKVQFIGGGFGNGKTAAACIKALRVAESYPGCNILIARSTYPKLNDTIRKEFLSWCPPHWIVQKPTKESNTVILKNGSTVNFRYVAQRGANEESTTSNLLSATYDLVIVDQMEDPEFVHKDFMDLMGRLRGSTPYTGSDPRMPKYGPQWFVGTLNPTRNWCYREIIKPIHDFKAGLKNDKLLCEVDSHGNAVVTEDGKPVPIIELFEGSTYENVDNVGIGYIQGMMSTFTGAMRERYVMGKWGALSGLVYPEYDESQHLLSHVDMREYLRQLRRSGYEPNWIEGYDHGLKAPSCYMLAFVDDDANVFVVDGFHKAEQSMETSAHKIEELRERYGLYEKDLSPIYADPALFRRHAAGGSKVGDTVAGLFQRDHQIRMQPGANDISSGIVKVSQYLTPSAKHEHPLTGASQSPHLFVNEDLSWFNNEMSEYYWAKDTSGNETDKPKDGNDHSPDTLKYLLTSRPKLAKYVGKPEDIPAYLSWHEIDRTKSKVKVKVRYK